MSTVLCAVAENEQACKIRESSEYKERQALCCQNKSKLNYGHNCPLSLKQALTYLTGSSCEPSDSSCDKHLQRSSVLSSPIHQSL